MMFKHLVAAAALAFSPVASLAHSVPTAPLAPAVEEAEGSELRSTGRGDFIVLGLFGISIALIITAIIKIIDDDKAEQPRSP